MVQTAWTPWIYEKDEQTTYLGTGPLIFIRIYGKGTFTHAYLAYHMGMRSYCIAKVITPASRDTRYAAKFLRSGEAQLISYYDKAYEELEILEMCKSNRETSNPVVHLYGIFEVNDHAVEVLELLPYPSLYYDEANSIYTVPLDSTTLTTGGNDHILLSNLGLHKLAEKVSDLIASVSFLPKLLEACSYIHGRNIYHKDIKPENFRLRKPWPAEMLRVVGPLKKPCTCPERIGTRNNEFECGSDLVIKSMELIWDTVLGSQPPEIPTIPKPTDTILSENVVDGALIDFNVATVSPDHMIWDAG